MHYRSDDYKQLMEMAVSIRAWWEEAKLETTGSGLDSRNTFSSPPPFVLLAKSLIGDWEAPEAAQLNKVDGSFEAAEKLVALVWSNGMIHSKIDELTAELLHPEITLKCAHEQLLKFVAELKTTSPFHGTFSLMVLKYGLSMRQH